MTKDSRFDNLGDRMKSHEAVTTSTKLVAGIPVVCRIDGRAFHTFCRGLEKPFCLEFVETMKEVCKYLVSETNAKLGYVQSDEISLCWENYTKVLFEGKLFKMQSVLASMTTAKFITYIFKRYLETQSNIGTVCTSSTPETNEEKEYYKWLILRNKIQNTMTGADGIIPTFDCRVFQVASMEELANYFIWREQDATRNSLSMLAQANFSHKQLQGKGRQDMHDMLHEKGINWNDLDPSLKRGTYFKRNLVLRKIRNISEAHCADIQGGLVWRSVVEEQDFPIMSPVMNKVGVYFNEEEPIFNT